MATTTAGTGNISSPLSGAIDLIEQSQQGFAKLESEARAKADAAKRLGTANIDEAGKHAVETKTRVSAKAVAEDESTAAAKQPANDDEASNAAARVTARYLANGDSDSKAAAKHPA